MDLRLDGSTALVTGGSRGIGLAVAISLAAEGARVALLGRDPDALAAAAALVGPGTVTVIADTTSDTQVRAAVEAAAGNAIRHAVTAEEVAHLVTFLASPLAALANGAVVTADGGRPGTIWA